MASSTYVLHSGQITVADASATTADASDLNQIDGITPGTVTASKALVVDSNKDIAAFRNLTGATITATTAFVGKLKGTVLAMTANGAVTIPAYSETIYFTKAGVCAATIVDPTATTHDGVRLTFVSTTTDANTLANTTGSGFNGGGASVIKATWGAAIGNSLTIEAYQGKWYVIGATGVTLGVA